MSGPDPDGTTIVRRMNGFRFATAADGFTPDGQPVVSPERGWVTDPHRQERILQYLHGGAPLYRDLRDGVDDPLRELAMSRGYRTDGVWIWPEAVPRYLEERGVAPEPDLYARIRAEGYYCPPVIRKTVWIAREALQEWVAAVGVAGTDPHQLS